MNRNTDSYFSHLPTLSFKRSRFKQQTVRRLQSQSHGTLTPFFIDIVYPGDTWSIDTNIFARADISLKVPLDTIFTDVYYFYVPFRILDKDFEKILGGVDAYDNNVYSFPEINMLYGDTNNGDVGDVFTTGSTADFTQWFLPFYLNYHVAERGDLGYEKHDRIMAYGPAAYYMIYNEFFRDENVDHIIPFDNFYNATLALYDNQVPVATGYDPTQVVQTLPLLQVNKYHDYFTSAIISPQKGPQVTLPLGLSAPVITSLDPIDVTGLPSLLVKDSDNSYPSNNRGLYTAAGVVRYNKDNTLTVNSSGQAIPANLVADLSNATAASINQFAIALKLEQLYQRRAVYGTRLTEIYRGQWGLNVPDDLIDRPEYLGGCKVDLNNIPVLNTTSVTAGSMVGNSATLFNDGGFTKSFLEYGVIIGLSATRIKHVYSQGVMKRLHDLRDGIDLYNPVFANLGPQGLYQREMWNRIVSGANTDQPDFETIFAYQEAWADLREGQSNVAGVFDPAFGGSSEYRNRWTYADYYSSAPLFSGDWLKESPENVCRTLSGTLISGAPQLGGHQFLFDYQSHVTVYRELPARSQLSLFERY